ncbi:hypothetical protein KP509_21G073900 [Ceratopteris richardii]|uniref:Two-component response regulator-like APRR2 n=1 Tax=Ceratopteris richardii TaxID=49495 RepID=A0A8T2SER0_CERRI|nr:hypothetical protein KP509_21G073900 [Ceratopteris richardii]
MEIMSSENEIAIPKAFLEKFPSWKSFPSGLRILVLDEDPVCLQESQAKLEACKYSVTPFSDRHDALEAVLNRIEEFHLVLIEVHRANAKDAFDVVRAAKQLPVVLFSATMDVSLMMEGIAAGASEFLDKPLSEEKAKNIWQHVFRKALITGELIPPKQESLRDLTTEEATIMSGEGTKCHVKEEPCTSEISSEPLEAENNCDQADFANTYYGCEDAVEIGALLDVKPAADKETLKDFMTKSPGPSTPQLNQDKFRASKDSERGSPHSRDLMGVSGILDDANSSDDCSSYVRVKTEVEDMDRLFQSDCEGDRFQSLDDFEYLDAALNDDEDLKPCGSMVLRKNFSIADELVDELSSCLDMGSSILDDLPSADNFHLSMDCMDEDDHHDEEALLLAEVAKAEAGMTSNSSNDHTSMGSTCSDMSGNEGKSCSDRLGKGSKCLQSSKKKMKVDWTPELHRRFVQAVEHLGVDKAIPSRILEIMGVQHLTRHNIASHLQKYRSHKKHIQAREAEAVTWNQRRQIEATRPPPQPAPIARPGTPVFPMGLHVWGHPTPEQYWPKPWQASDGALWHQPAPVCLDAWGHPAPGTPFFHPSQCVAPVLRLPLAPIPGAVNRVLPVQMPNEKLIPGIHLPKDKVNAAISEVLKDPCAPLPLGLKPPSLESVLSELQRQGIKTVPPTSS